MVKVGTLPQLLSQPQRRALRGRGLRDGASCSCVSGRREGPAVAYALAKDEKAANMAQPVLWWWRCAYAYSSAHPGGVSLRAGKARGASGRLYSSLHEVGAATAAMKPARAEQAHQEDAQPWQSRL